jgi:Asp-tRNA(Asn)/Glu-tRNA(Gln) amidotransferase A subunit family amidase
MIELEDPSRAGTTAGSIPATNPMSATDLARRIRSRTLSARDAVGSCLARIAAREPELHAWSFIDPKIAVERARLADDWQAQGLPLGPLHGVPVGVKDVFDTCDFPSEYGSSLYRGRRPERDAAVVAVLRQAGAIILGKTTTSEFGMYHQSAARNPHAPDRSAGVSSSGSAVAVVDHMVPIAIGTQHTASTLLPASFCGAVGFKPSFGFTDMTGSNILVPRLAQLGLLARDLEDLSLLVAVFSARAVEPLIARQPFRIGVVRGPSWSLVDRPVAAAFERWLPTLGTSAADVELPAIYSTAVETVMTLLDAHLAHRFDKIDTAAFEALCSPLRDCITRGQTIAASRLIEANDRADALALSAREIFEDVDVLITLSAPTEATLIADGPGSGMLTMPWSLCGLPTLSLPLLKGANALPVGVQLIAAQGEDLRLLTYAAWLLDRSSVSPA